MNKLKKVASFTVFSNDFKSKLTTAYPFLSADQIQLRLRKKWNNLSPDERILYHKVVFCPVVNNSPTKKQCNKSKKEKKITAKDPKDKKIDLKELTIFDDDLKFMYGEKYEEGCFDDIFDRNENDQLNVKVTKSDKTYLKSRYVVNHPIPIVIDETPFGQQGILKKSSSDKEKKMKVQFNFSAEHKNIDQYRKKQGKNCKETEEVDTRSKPEENAKGLKNDHTSSKPKNSSSKKSKAKNKDQNSQIPLGSLESNEEFPYEISSSDDEEKLNENLGPSENVELSTPELQRNISPRIIEKMCQAPKKRAVKGNFTSMDNSSEKRKNETSLIIGNLDKMVLRRRPSFQKENLIEEKFEFDSPLNKQFKDEEFLTNSMGNSSKRNKSLSYMNITKSDQWPNMQDFYADPPSPSLDDELDLSTTNENIDTSIGWELSDEESSPPPPPIKHSTPLENTLELMKKSVSSSFISIASNSSDNCLSDCSSLSGFSELSDQEMDINDNDDVDDIVSVNEEEEELEEELSFEMQSASIDGISAGGDLQNEVLKKDEESDYEYGDVLCDMFDEKHSALTKTRFLPPPGNNGEKITTQLFEEAEIFG